MDLTVKITPRVSPEVARRLRLAAGMRLRSMSAVVNDALDATLPSLEEIGTQLTGPAAGDGGPRRSCAGGKIGRLPGGEDKNRQNGP